MDRLENRNPGQTEFLQAVREVAEKVIPFVREHPEYEKAQILERIAEPDRVIHFRVTWEDDNGAIHVNRGYRVQANNAIGPYKGGLRVDPSVTLSVLNFLAFEPVFKNSLPTPPTGGAKAGRLTGTVVGVKPGVVGGKDRRGHRAQPPYEGTGSGQCPVVFDSWSHAQRTGFT